MYILGISAFYHDSAAALIRDGEVIAAAQEERFSRKKHDERFPINAVNYCLQEAQIDISRVDAVAYYEKPFLKFERLLFSYLHTAPLGFRSFAKALPQWLKKKLFIRSEIKKYLKLSSDCEIYFVPHHESHAGSAFYPAPFDSAAILTMDGVGEWATSSIGYGRRQQLNLLKEITFPHSLGLLYSAFTYYTGFKVNSGEYKLMGLAPYGEPRYVRQILENLIDLKPDGSFRLNLTYFDYISGLTMTNSAFDNLFGGTPRRPEQKITQRDMDLARSIQDVTEEVMMRMAQTALKISQSKNLCLAGGVALNCVGNGKILKKLNFDRLWIQPASGDAGGALGAALIIWHKVLGHPRVLDSMLDSQKGSLLGPSFDRTQIGHFLESQDAFFEFFEVKTHLYEKVAHLLAQGKVVGFFNGKMEFGPRALGARSILGDARSPKMQKIMNLKIKFRESFRPFAPIVLKEDLKKYFELEHESPYMLLVAPLKKQLRRKLSVKERKLFGINKLNIRRSSLPAITHVDYSARIQTVDPQRNPDLYALLNTFKKQTGCAVLVNTSFNVRGEPMVCTPADAYRCFLRTDMDFLVLENFLVRKDSRHRMKRDKSWYNEFSLD